MLENLLSEIDLEVYTPEDDDMARCMWCCDTGGGGKARYEE